MTDKSTRGSRASETARKKYGPDYFVKIGHKGGSMISEERGPEFYAQIGKKGGEATKERHGSAHYAEIGRKGGQNNAGKPRNRQRSS